MTRAWLPLPVQINTERYILPKKQVDLAARTVAIMGGHINRGKWFLDDEILIIVGLLVYIINKIATLSCLNVSLFSFISIIKRSINIRF